MKTILSFYVTGVQAKNTLAMIGSMESNCNIHVGLEESTSDGLIKGWGDVAAPKMHEELVHTFAELNSYYGPLTGVSFMTSSRNVMSIALTTENIEDVTESQLLVIQYNGTRGRFVEEMANWFKEATVEQMVFSHDPETLIVPDDSVGENQVRNDAVALYETEGPVGMYPWESKYDYVVRKGGNVLRKEVVSILEKLYSNDAIEAKNLFKMSVKDGEKFYTELYTGAASIGVNDNAIIDFWFADVVTRDNRVTVAKGYFKARELADNLLTLVM